MGCALLPFTAAPIEDKMLGYLRVQVVASFLVLAVQIEPAGQSCQGRVLESLSFTSRFENDALAISFVHGQALDAVRHIVHGELKNTPTRLGRANVSRAKAPRDLVQLEFKIRAIVTLVGILYKYFTDLMLPQYSTFKWHPSILDKYGL